MNSISVIIDVLWKTSSNDELLLMLDWVENKGEVQGNRKNAVHAKMD